MTELKKKTERDPLDRYYTPPALADACLRWTWARVQAEAYPGAEVAPQRVAEPCAGAGAFAGATLVRGAPSTFYNHSRTLQPNGRRKTRLRPPTRNVGLRPGTPSSQAS
jgi:hypothetical protein